MTTFFQKIVGPRAPADTTEEERKRFLAPTLLFAAAGILLLISIFLPYWHMELLAPQYPKGLHITAYIDELEGDLFEINTLNHYIGMRPLEEAAQFERSVSAIAIGAVALLIVAAIFIHTKWAALLALPAILMPVMFLADLQFWMYQFGTNLNEEAPLSNSIKPFVPIVLGRGKIAQFETVGTPGAGLYLAFLTSILVIVGLYFHRKAYKPLVEKEQLAAGGN
ncbi:MAG: cytochrome C [Chloroflexi bacterium]|nr:cytochrome C [Chloroflexota bacterium]